MSIDHQSILVPQGVETPRFRAGAAASNAAVLSLDGKWQFRLFQDAGPHVPRDDQGTEWDTIDVPGHWQLAQAPEAWPYGTPAYNNKYFPFPLEPPLVPDHNPTGEYRLNVQLPEDWPTDGRSVLRFEGVDSWFEVAINGEVVAVSHGSRLPTEIDITDHLDSRELLLAVRVTKWSAYSYIEDQDQWWLSGIFRSVTLEHRPVQRIDHVRVHAGYDHETGLGLLRVDVEGTAPNTRVAIPELELDIRPGEEASVPVQPWSAEVPRLYRMNVITDEETIGMEVGFRTVTVDGPRLLVNGEAIKLRGVNRHEFEPLRGRAVTAETMLQDVLLMKRHNINAVRTSHYPPHPHFLDLCDRYGLYVMDENDLETHGFEDGDWADNPVNDPAWANVLVDRVTRMVRRDAHHPSIILWSLGNEAGSGCNIEAMANAVRQLDPSRPIHYEGDFSSDHVDVYSRMYPPTEYVALVGQGHEPQLQRAEADAERRTMPFVLCEYAHAMGNGPGGLSNYDELIDKYPRLAGGFIWEWIDHGILRHDDQSRPFHAYGGDFGESFHDGTFIADGLLFPDRTPSPSLREVAAVFAPIRIDTTGDGSLRVRNRYAFRDTGHVTFEWRIHRRDESLSSGVLDIHLAPGESTVISPPEHPELAPDRAPTWFTIRAVQHKPHPLEEPWFDGPFTIASGQLLLQPAAKLDTATGHAAMTPDRGFKVGHGVFDRHGTLIELHGRKVTTCRVDAWRAPTDNDRRAAMWTGLSDEDLWRSSGLHLLTERKIKVEFTEDGILVVEARTAGPATRNGFLTRYEWRATDAGGLDLMIDIVPRGRWDHSLPRLGLLLALEQEDAEEITVKWLGLGPDESYADSMQAALGGEWTHTVSEMQTNYTHPQENGARRGVSEAHLIFPDESSLLIETGQVFLGGEEQHGVELSLRPWSDLELEVASHPHDLRPDGRLWLHLDIAQHGVGSAACGPGVLPDAHLRPAPAQMNVRFTSRPST